MTGTAGFWDKIADKYSKTPIADEAAYQKKLEISRQFFTPDMKLFEFGCGTGGTALMHAPYVSHIEAVDVSSNMIAIANKKREEAGIDNVTFSVADINDYQEQAGSYDAVLGLSILHLLDNRMDILKKVNQLLKPGGVFISSTACLQDAMWYLKLVLPLGRMVGLIPPHVAFFTTEELRKNLVDSGFSIENEWAGSKGPVRFFVARKKAQTP